MSKKSLVIVCLALVLIMFLSVLVSAGLFSDWWRKITGKVTEDFGACFECVEELGEWCEEDSYCKTDWDPGAICSSGWITDEDGCPCPTCADVPECSGWECGYCYDALYHCGFLDCGTCDFGYECSLEHVCVSTQICEDSDGGNYSRIAGTCTNPDGTTLTDFCYTSGTIFERYCLNNLCVTSIQGCPAGYTCYVNKCICTPDCTEKECGDDGCGGKCHGVGDGESTPCIVDYGVCQETGTKTCTGTSFGLCTGTIDPRTSNCEGKECGDDGCGGSCGSCTTSGKLNCNTAQICVECISADNCSGTDVCNADGQCESVITCDDTCSSLGYECDYEGNKWEICGVDETCGGDCPENYICNSAGKCVILTCNYDFSEDIANDYLLNVADKSRIKKFMRSISINCDINFQFDILDELPTNYTRIQGKKIIKILNITADQPNIDAILGFTLNQSEIMSSISKVIIYGEDDTGGWEALSLEGDIALDTTDPSDNSYTYKVSTSHFSLFLITEPELCGNRVFDSDYEECDGSVSGVTNCTACVCDLGFKGNESGFCLEGIGGTKCSEEGDEDCTGYALSECNSSLIWEDKGIVIDKCGVECEKGNTSCQGDYSLRCGSNYKWVIQGKINGLCGYESPISGSLLTDTTSIDVSGADTRKEPPAKTIVILLIVLIALLIIVVLFILFKKFGKQKRRYAPSRPGPVARPTYPGARRPPAHRSYPTRNYPK